MKFRNFLIVLLAVLMVFAFASCNNNPEPKKETGKIYKLTATTGRDSSWNGADKFILHFSGTELETGLEDGDVFSFMFRSTRDFSQYSVRNSKCAWEYEQEFVSSDGGNLLLEEGEDGWTTVTYTFSTSPHNGSKTAPDYNNPDHIGDFRFDLRGSIIKGDYVEIKEVTFNGYDLALTKNNVPDHSDSYYGAVNPEFSIVNDHEWTVAKTYVVYYTTESLSDAHTPDYVETVAQGDTIAADIARENYSFKLYTSSSFSDEFDAEKAITKDTTIYVKYTGDPMTVTFNVGETGSAVTSQTVEYGTYATKPETDPTNTNENLVFAGWYVGDKPFDFATTQILADTEIVAKWGAPVAVTFDAENGAENEETVVIVASGCPVAKPTDPTFGSKIFEGWFLGEATEAYDFSTPVTAAITLKAKWTNATTVTLDLNYTGAPTAKTIQAELDAVLAADDEKLIVKDNRIGHVFAGWYDEANCNTAHNFSNIVTGEFTLYAKWVEAPLYKLVATGNAADGEYSKDKLAIVHSTADVDDGDVLSFRFRTTRDFRFFSIRRAGGGKKWIYQNSNAEANYGFTSYETKADGWTYVTYKFDKATAVDSADIPAEDADFEIHFGNRWNDPTGNTGIVAGDILEIQDWAINGVPMEIAAGDVTSYAGATVSVVEGGSYAWTSHTVTFVTGEGSSIGPVEVEFNGKLALPEDPILAGKLFAGWFTDTAFEHPFDADTLIIKDLSLYAKYADAVTVSFNGAELEDVTIAKGNKVTKPADPAKAENVFGGWYADPDFNTEFDFSVAIEANTTIYAKWIPSWTVTLNYNYGETPETKTVYVAKSTVMSAPDSIARVGYFFDGWYDDAAGSTAHNWEVAVTANTTIYAKWSEPTEAYKFTATVAEGRFQFRWKGETVEMLKKVQPGDVFTFMVKFAETNSQNPYKLYLKVRSPETEIKKEYLGTAEGSGWYSYTITVPEKIEGEGVYLMVYAPDDTKWAVGDSMILKAFAYNGTAIPVEVRAYGTKSSTYGAYEKTCADCVAVNPDGTPKAE